MIEQQLLQELIDASPMVVFFIVVCIVALAAIRALPGIQEKEIRRLEVIGANNKNEAEANSKVADAAMKAFNAMGEVYKETMLEQRRFNAERTDSLLAEMRDLQEQVTALKDELKQKEIVIRSQAQRIQGLEDENVTLKQEVELLRRKVEDGKRPTRKKVA